MSQLSDGHHFPEDQKS